MQPQKKDEEIMTCPIWDGERPCLVEKYAEYGASCKFYVNGKCVYSEKLEKKTERVKRSMMTYKKKAKQATRGH